MAFSKTLYLITAFIFLLTSFGGFILSPSFFLFDKARAEGFQSSVNIVVCGNGVIEPGEACDDGVINNGQYGYCKSDCSGMGPYCGDGILQSNYEQCDDGNTNSGDGCDASCQTEEAPLGPVGGAVIFIPPAIETKVVLKGKAYPFSQLTALKDGRVIAIGAADSQAKFKIEIGGIQGGTYTFGIWAKDTKGRKSVTFTFTTSVKSGTITTIDGIFVPPTIELQKSSLQKGETLNVSGQTAPSSEVTILFTSQGEEIIKKTKAEADGDWFYFFDTTPLEEDSYNLRAKASSPDGLLSTWSQALSFFIGKEVIEFCPGADFNKDGSVNLIDFSILLYWWGSNNNCCDQNQDGIVDLIDFSIMLYYWTG